MKVHKIEIQCARCNGKKVLDHLKKFASSFMVSDVWQAYLDGRYVDLRLIDFYATEKDVDEIITDAHGWQLEDEPWIFIDSPSFIGLVWTNGNLQIQPY